MKKIITILIVLMAVSLCACSSNTANETPAPAAEAVKETATATAEDVEADLQGEWRLLEENKFFFDNGDISIISGGNSLSGTYEILTDVHNIKASLKTSNGSVTIEIPYEYVDGSLVIYNNQEQALVKQ